MILREININDLAKLLTEDQESDSIKKAIALYMNRMGCTKQEAEKFVRIDLRQDLPNLRSKKGGKFILGVTRMFLDRELTNAETILKLDNTIRYVASDAHYNEYDKNLNGLKANEIIERFSDAIQKDSDADRAKLSQQKYEDNNLYDIVRVNNFEETSKYREYCYPMDQWCITKYPSMLESYTNNGIGQFYFCLKKGFENMEPVEGENCPLDEYGLSMIAVCVDGEGRLKTSTCRWNHSNGGSDNILTTEQISNIIGKNFYDVFKPNNSWNEKIEEYKTRLRNGEDVGSVFDSTVSIADGVWVVRYGSLYNIYDENKKDLCSEKWFEYIDSKEICGFHYIKRNGEWFYFSRETKQVYTQKEVYSQISKTISSFLENGGTVEELQERGIISRFWKSYRGHYEITVLHKRNIVTEDNKILFPEWHDSVDIIKKGNEDYYRIKDDNYYLLDNNMNNILGRGYRYISSVFSRGKIISVLDEEGANLIDIDQNNKKLCRKSLGTNMYLLRYNAENSSMNLFSVTIENEVYICNENGDFVINESFDDINSMYSDSSAYVKKDNQEAILYLNDMILSDWYDSIDKKFISTYSPLITVHKGDKISFINFNTKEQCDMWFDKVEETRNSQYSIVYSNGLCNFIFENGSLALNEWMKKIEPTEKDMYKFYLTNTQNKKNIYTVYNYKNHELLLKKWVDDIEYLGDYKVRITNNNETIERSFWALEDFN